MGTLGDQTRAGIQHIDGETGRRLVFGGVLGEFPAWDVTLERQKQLPARLDAVLFPMPPGTEGYPTVQRLRADAQVTAFRITGEGFSSGNLARSLASFCARRSSVTSRP